MKASSKMRRNAEIFFIGVVSKQKILQGICQFSKIDEIKEGAGLEIIGGKCYIKNLSLFLKCLQVYIFAMSWHRQTYIA
jgi:hypothetical protein